MDISVVIPVKNGGNFLAKTLDALLLQDFTGLWEVCIYNDGSDDGGLTESVILEYSIRFRDRCIGFVSGKGEESGGVGLGKNKASRLGSGRFLCFNDADDESSPDRLTKQFTLASSLFEKNPLVLVGSQFTRSPDDSTTRFTRWANELPDELLGVQVFTSHGPTLIAPTWFISRQLFDEVGGFHEERSGYPEDLHFFYDAIDKGASLAKVWSPVVMYRYHPGCATFSVHESTIWDMRMTRLQNTLLASVEGQFDVWSAGKQGKRFFKSLSPANQSRVRALLDVDEKKVRRGKMELYDDVARRVTHTVPIQHVECARPPVVVCVKLDLTGGELERLIAAKAWNEGVDFHLFS